MKAEKKILLIGGGTGGHIMPLYPLATELIKNGHQVDLIVNDHELDRQIIKDSFGLNSSQFKTYYFRAFKIHYHFSFQSFTNAFKILGSILKAKKIIKNLNPDVIFFKGGFVGFPFLLALKYLSRFKGRIYLHESDIVTGTLGKYFEKSADKVFRNFGRNATPLFYDKKLKKTETKSGELQNILIFGGSQGAEFLNKLIEQNQDALLQKYNIKLVTGIRDKIKASPKNKNLNKLTGRLEQFDLLPQEEIIQAIHDSDLVITRASGSIFQILSAQKKSLLIPLPTSARDHQRLNAEYFKEQKLAYTLEQKHLTDEVFVNTINQILKDEKLAKNLKSFNLQSCEALITQTITT